MFGRRLLYTAAIVLPVSLGFGGYADAAARQSADLDSAARATSTKTRSVSGTPGLTLKVVAIKAGRLVVQGTAAAAGTKVRINGTPLVATADGSGTLRSTWSTERPVVT